MTSTTDAPRSALLGSQRPRLWSGPSSSLSEAGRVSALAAEADLRLDEWQSWVLDEGLGRMDDGMWAAFEVCLIVARQNGKGSVLEALELAALFLDDFGVDLILHSAHEFKTAAEAFRRIEARIEKRPSLRRLVRQIYRQRGAESIELRNGKRLRFVARTGGSGRGFTADLIVLDEAYELGDDEMGALLPTLSARPNPQIWYTSTAGKPTSTQLGAVRERGIRGDASLAFFEWSADEDGYDPADPADWALANPGMGIRISQEYIAKERAALSADEFARERLSIGDYPTAAGEWSVIRRAVWESRADPESPRPRPQVAIAADASPGQVSGAVAVAGWRPDRRIVVEIPEGDHRPGVGWMVPRLAEMSRKHRPCAIVIDPRGPAAGLIPEAERAGLEIVKPTMQESAQAFAQFYAGVTEGEGSLAHLGQPELAAALAGATVRETGDGGKLWARRDTTVDISPLVAVTLAHWAAAKFGRNYDVLRSVVSRSQETYEERKTLSNQIYSVLSICGTYKALLDRWPESAPYIPSSETAVVLPMIQLDDLNAKLGLSKEAA